MFVSCVQNVKQNHNIRRGNKSFESMAEFRYFGTTQTKTTFVKKLGTD
jgi:hypothetical protein